MNNKLLLPLLALLGLGIFAIWSWGGGDSAGSALSGEAALEGGGEGLALSSDDSALPGFQAAENEVRRELTAAPEVSRTKTKEVFDLRAAPSNSTWIEGVVLFPDRMPLDTGDVEVTARGRGFGDSTRREHTVTANASGEFRVAFAKETRKGWLSVRGRYLFTHEKTALNLKDLPAEVLLEPELGGVLRGVVQAPIGLSWSAAAREGARVSVESWGRSGRVSRSSDIDAQGRFELCAVPAGDYRVRVRIPLWVDQSKSDVDVRAGETTDIDFQLKPGSVIAGRVLNDDEEGRGGVSVELTGSSADDNWIREFVLTNPDGSFELVGVAEGTLSVKAAMDEALVAEVELGFLRGGTRRDDVVLRISVGNSIRGVVRWPDGSPVSGASVNVTQDREQDGLAFDFFDGTSEKTKPDGSFEISGLEPSVCVVRATAKSFRKEDIAKAEARAAAGKKARKLRARGPTYTVRKEKVAPGTTGLVLVLDPGDTLSGRVVDDAGEGLKKFMLTASPVASKGFMDADAVNRLVLSTDGRFTVDGLSEGTWEVRVAADDHEVTQKVTVKIPGAAELEFVVNRLSEVRGVVRDPSGEPISGAGIWVRRLAEGDAFVVDEIFGDWGEAATTDQNGKFKARDVRPGRLRVWSKADGFASSPAQELVVEPGGTLEGVSLRLRQAGRIRGQLHSLIADRERRSIQIQAERRGSYWETVETDSRGEFEFDGLDTGSYRLTLESSSDSVTPDSEQKDVGALVEVGDGDTVHVVLGAPPANPSTVSGVVRTAAGPLAGVLVRCRAESDWRLNNDVTRTGSDGVYHLTLNEPGQYNFSVGDEERGQTQYKRELKQGVNVDMDFLLASGIVRGQVLGPQGAVKKNCVMTLEVVSLLTESSDPTPLRRIRTDDQGRFEFNHVAGGTYHLRANDEPVFRWRRRRTTLSGTQIVENLALAENAASEDFVFRLEEEAEVSGEVTTPDGEPAVGATVRVFTPGGTPLHTSSSVRCDAAGRFTAGGIGLDKALLEASLGGKTGPRRALSLSPGNKTELSLEVDRP